jgi:hypothetical protein
LSSGSRLPANDGNSSASADGKYRSRYIDDRNDPLFSFGVGLGYLEPRNAQGCGSGAGYTAVCSACITGMKAGGYGRAVFAVA